MAREYDFVSFPTLFPCKAAGQFDTAGNSQVRDYQDNQSQVRMAVNERARHGWRLDQITPLGANAKGEHFTQYTFVRDS